MKDGRLTAFESTGNDIPIDNTHNEIVFRADRTGDKILAGGNEGNLAYSKDGGKTWASINWKDGEKPKGGGITDAVYDSSAGKWLIAHQDDLGKTLFFSTDGTEIKSVPYGGSVFGLISISSSLAFWPIIIPS